MGKILKITLLWILLIPIPTTNLCFMPVHGQSNSSANEKHVTGRVIDEETREPIEFTQITLSYKGDTAILSQTISDKSGLFTLSASETGEFTVEAKMVGYASATSAPFTISKTTRVADVGDIELTIDYKTINEIMVKANSNRTTVGIDKTVVNVQDLASGEGGSAADLLTKLPAITKTPGGQIAVHGNSNFLVLVNGKPTALKGNELLQSIPAGEVYKVELITNPSARYDASGTAGIINIITKNNSSSGFSGNINLATDQLGGYSSDIIVNYQSSKIALFLGADHNKRRTSGNSERTTQSADNYTMNQIGEQRAHRLNTGLRAGIEYNPDAKNSLYLSANHGTFDTRNFGDWNSSFSSTTITEENSDRNKRLGSYNGLTGSYQHTFDTNQAIVVSAIWNRNNFDDSYINQVTSDNTIKLEQITRLSKLFDEYQFNIDYNQPLGNWGNIEAGYQFYSDNQDEDYFTERTDASDTESSDNATEFNRTIHSGYLGINGKSSTIEWKAGLRGEYFDRELITNSDNYARDKFDIYPSLHFAWSADAKRKLIVSFNRRTNKPSAAELDPLPRWYDLYLVRTGNPLLTNEISNKVSTLYTYSGDKLSLSSEAYFLSTRNKINNLRFLYDGLIVQQKAFNIGRENVLGLDLNASYILTPWLTLSEKVEYFANRTRADQPENSCNFNQLISFTTSKFTITPTTYLELEVDYYGPSETAQTQMKSFLLAGATFRQQLFKRRMSLTFTGRDIFQLYQSNERYSGFGLTQHTVSEAILPFRVSLSFKINNYKRDLKQSAKTPPGE